MAERLYTVREIDRMRRVLTMSYPPGVTFRQSDRSAEVEDRIRTYMSAGVDPAEVIAYCNEQVARYQQVQAHNRQREADERAAREQRGKKDG